MIYSSGAAKSRFEMALSPVERAETFVPPVMLALDSQNCLQARWRF